MATNVNGFSFKEAIAYANSRGVVLPDEYYGKLTGTQRNQATTVSGLASLEQIKYVIDQVNDAMAKGKTFKQVQDAVKASELDIKLPQYRLDNIFRTNVQSAYSRGRWDQQQRFSKTRPYLMYDAINDSRTRPSHMALDNTILRYDHPFWQTHYTPNGYRCRCTVISLTTAQAEKRGITLHPPEVDPDEGWNYNIGEQYSEPATTLLAATPLKGQQNVSAQALAQFEQLFGIGTDAKTTKALRDRAILAPDGMNARAVQTIVGYVEGNAASVNTLLHEGLPSTQEAFAALMDEVRDNALATSPAGVGDLWRGSKVSIGSIQQIKQDLAPGTVIGSKGFMATLRHQDAAAVYGSTELATEKTLLYKIAYKGSGGVEAGDLGSEPGEVLFWPGKEQFQVVSVVESERTITVNLKPSKKPATSGFDY